MYPLTFYGLTGCALTPTPSTHNTTFQPPLHRQREREQSMHLSISLWTSSALLCSTGSVFTAHVTVPPTTAITTTTHPLGQVMNTHNAAEVKNVAEMPLFPFSPYSAHAPTWPTRRVRMCVCAQLTPKCHEGGGGRGGCDT